jgi:hypothetical protein
MSIPDLLLCVGAQKSGTTWLYNRLVGHDAMRTASHKETHYFNAVHCGGVLGPQMKMNMMRHMIDSKPSRVIQYLQAQATGEELPPDIHRVFRAMDDEWYEAFFDTPGRFAMDFTPEYALLPDAGHQHIKRLSERQKVVFLMREPVERASSAIRYFCKQRGCDVTTMSDEEIFDIARKPFIASMSRYDKTLSTLARHYDDENLLFLFYENMMADKAGTLDTVCDWLGIERLDLPADQLERRDNPTEAHLLPTPVIEELRRKLSPVRRAVEARFPEARSAWADFVPA